MSKKINSYSFLPWIREGIANQMQKNPGKDKIHATLDASFNIKGSGLSGNINREISKTISLYGPGDIIGIDSRAIIKTEPLDWITNFEPNYLPCIDFYDEDFPWRYSPVLHDDTTGRLLPWLALVVLEEGSFTDGRDMTGHPLPYIQLNNDVEAKNVFQPSDQLWAWAHVHVNRDLIQEDNADVERVIAKVDELTTVLDQFKETLAENPDLAYSRIMCPIKLNENTAYHAFLIPSFESGRLAGLGKNIEEIFYDDNSLLQHFTPAWTNSNENDEIERIEGKKFPVYHRWYFRTGNVGDFEYLVRLLEPKPMDVRVGRRDMDVTDPGSNITGIGDDPENGTEVPQLGGVLRLGGALQIPVDTMKEEDLEEYKKYENWDQPYPRNFQKQLAAFINLTYDYSKKPVKVSHNNDNLSDTIKTTASEEDDPDPLITSPLYGKWHALTERLLTEDDENHFTNWVHRLNLDPRYRVSAGFGTGVVQKNQENYMESAWKQVGNVIEANRRIRQAQFAQFAAKKWFGKYLEEMKKTNVSEFLWLTQPVQTRVLSRGIIYDKKEEKYREDTATVKYQVMSSKVPNILLSPSIRKSVRPKSRLRKLLPFDDKSFSVGQIINRINKDEIHTAPPKTTPFTLLTLKKFVQSIMPGKIPEFLLKWIENYPWFKYIVLVIALIIIVLLVIFIGPNLGSITLGTSSVSGTALLIAIILLYLYIRIAGWEKQINKIITLREENQTSEEIERLPNFPDFRLSLAGEDIQFSIGEIDSQESVRFKKALGNVAELMQAILQDAKQPQPPPLNINEIATATLNTLDPEKSITDYIHNNRVILPERLKSEQKGTGLKEAMAYPEIDTPMYKPLIDISAELFLPNINFVSQNSISLLETNQNFIESYMVGLNHEFARELLWREYPTDQRGSYFRQFWDVSDFNYQKKDIDKLKGIVQEKLPASASDEEINEKLQEEIRESLLDIPRIHHWSRDSELGEHDHRENYKEAKLSESSINDEEDKKEVVLVIRGELLKKYPNAVIYAHKAEWQLTEGEEIDNSKERILAELTDDKLDDPPRTIVKTPLYEAKAEPDIYFFGFDLDVITAKGGSGESGDTEPGWFFVIQERAGEPRFGLDVGNSGEIQVWNDLAWGNENLQVNSGSFLQVLSGEDNTIKVSSNEPCGDDIEKLPQWPEDKQIEWHENMNSAELAYILFQSPMMIAVHAAKMLPKQ